MLGECEICGTLLNLEFVEYWQTAPEGHKALFCCAQHSHAWWEKVSGNEIPSHINLDPPKRD